ncbi:MAG: 4a-hydroxytetrahydrobiopterin dehydratase [Candidatus Azotimanducaceae bacterium]|uniref:4a-hydroxytetrahydrobiopterin dehydratase n=1 Tax=OM182 bacterium TaxID=2510334 RepID=A0A520RXJ2_9GAMM|nr:4a-hydroxytetrahydrobiopterin dehydratase [Gammaproteobacteria bacterium]OUV67890.1 MAG: hypothetical protein CBC93_03995 [Gammaproteobacteria bacterium TMED133]RZO74911.1 MAG: 4a-hydroxytetrahydrobiopterin dehydratase [OM182 bacterium]
MTIRELYFQSSSASMPIDTLELDSLMDELPQWEIQGLSIAYLVRDYKCTDFLTAMALAKKITDLAELYNHHPELTIRWGKLSIKWWTHTANGITNNDVYLAHQCDLINQD